MIDVRTRDKTNAEIEAFISKFRAICVRDERKHPVGQKIWSGAHLHLEITDATDAALRGFQRRNNLIADDNLRSKNTRRAQCDYINRAVFHFPIADSFCRLCKYRKYWRARLTRQISCPNGVLHARFIRFSAKIR